MRLFYVADPMCSWCWGFSSTIAEIERQLRPEVTLQLVLGGLAPDSEAPMDAATKRYVQEAWSAVEAQTGATFDHSFWERCEPRRSTWPACRAVIAAADRGREMFNAIQRAYYTEARDPSDRGTLVDLGEELGFDRLDFRQAIDAPETHARLEADLALRNELGISGFPSLAIERDGEKSAIVSGWSTLEHVRMVLGQLRMLA